MARARQRGKAQGVICFWKAIDAQRLRSAWHSRLPCGAVAKVISAHLKFTIIVLAVSYFLLCSFLPVSNDEALILLCLSLKIGQGSTPVVDTEEIRVRLTLINPALNPFLPATFSRRQWQSRHIRKSRQRTRGLIHSTTSAPPTTTHAHPSSIPAHQATRIQTGRPWLCYRRTRMLTLTNTPL